MNGKTAKLIRRYSMMTGDSNKQLKNEWTASTSRERFEKRQQMLQDLKGSKK